MKNYVITGSIGHISKPVIINLVKAGKNVKVVTTNPSKIAEIEALGAKALVGSAFDGEFLKKAFTGADVVYLMIPPIWQTENWLASQQDMSNKYAEAIRVCGVKYVVNLSSIGAHLPSGVGPVSGLHYLEGLLNKISGLHVKHLRPGFFYYNFLHQIGMVKNAGIFGGNYGENTTMYLTDPSDIAQVASQELLDLSFNGNSVRYIISDEHSVNEVAKVLSKSIGRDVPWVNFTDEEQKNGLLGAGLPETIANGYVDMGQTIRSGKMWEDMLKNKPKYGETKLEDFANQFKVVFNS